MITRARCCFCQTQAGFRVHDAAWRLAASLIGGRRRGGPDDGHDAVHVNRVIGGPSHHAYPGGGRRGGAAAPAAGRDDAQRLHPAAADSSNATASLLGAGLGAAVQRGLFGPENYHVGTTSVLTFAELVEGYHYSSTTYNRRGDIDGLQEDVWFPMDQPIQCSYETERGLIDYHKGTTTPILPPPGTITENPSNDGNIEKVEWRGITLRQLRAVWANVKRRCQEEKWENYEGKLLTPEQVSLYDVHEYVIKPFTFKSQRSFVETLPSTAGPQPPRWFVSHYWGESIEKFLACLETHNHNFWMNEQNTDHDERGGGMTIDTPYWICAYANNQWDLSESLTKDPSKSSFTRALEVANGRTLSILDEPGIVFTRVWCGYEIYLTLLAERKMGSTRVWAIYTAHSHEVTDGFGNTEFRDAVGIVSGGATADFGETNQRESYFPFNLILDSLEINIETAKASVEADRTHILNVIIGRTDAQLDKDPVSSHPNYDSLNTLIRSSFASSGGSLQAAYNHGQDSWVKMLDAMSKGTMTDPMEFDFHPIHGNWENLTTEDAAQLILHLPLTIRGLTLENAATSFKADFIFALVEWMEKASNLESLEICSSTLGDEEGGQDEGARLAKALSSNKTITGVDLKYTDLVGFRNASAWAEMLATTATLKVFTCNGLGDFVSTVDENDHGKVVKFGENGNFQTFFKDGIFPDAMLTDDGLEILAEGIVSNTSLESIKLKWHGIGPNGIASLGRALMKNKTVTELDLWERGLEETKKAEFEEAVEKLRHDTARRNPSIHIFGSFFL